MHSRQLLCDVAIAIHLTFGAKDPHGVSVQCWVNLGLCENLDSGLDWTGLDWTAVYRQQMPPELQHVVQLYLKLLPSFEASSFQFPKGQRSRAYLMSFNRGGSGWIPVGSEPDLSIHDFYPLFLMEATCICLNKL